MALPTVNIGDPIISEDNFHSATFNYTPAVDGLNFGTSNVPGSRDGKMKAGFYLSNITNSGAIWGSDSPYGPAAINHEEQIYAADPKYPHPAGYSPFSIENGRLVTTSRPVNTGDAAEYDWARVKGYQLTADGQTLEQNFLQDKRVRYISGMLSTYGRHSMSFGRRIVKGSTPYGAVGNSADINQRRAVFPALQWDLQDVPYGRDVNGEILDGGATTYMPGKLNGGGIMTELDGDENFGESQTVVHQTTHLHKKNLATTELTAKQLEIGQDLLTTSRITGYDVLPNQIAFFINGVYTHIVPTPDEMKLPMPIYETVAGQPWKVAMDGINAKLLSGNQKHSDGSDRYMQFAHIHNLARDGKYPRDLARQIFESGGTLPPHPETCHMYLDWFRCYPLKTDNPDTRGVRVNGVEVETATSGIFAGGISNSLRPKRTTPWMELPNAYVKGEAFTWIGHAPDGVDDDSYDYQWTHDFGTKLGNLSDLNKRIVTGVAVEDVAAGESVLHNIGMDANPQ